jgi:hypothetical protein
MAKLLIVDTESAREPGEVCTVVAECSTLDDAMAWLSQRALTEPEKVERGAYQIDAED